MEGRLCIFHWVEGGAPDPHVIQGSAIPYEVLGAIDTQISGGSFYIGTMNM